MYLHVNKNVNQVNYLKSLIMTLTFITSYNIWRTILQHDCLLNQSDLIHWFKQIYNKESNNLYIYM